MSVGKSDTESGDTQSRRRRTKSKARWLDKEPINPRATVVVGTLFSGIGAIEHALERLGIRYKIAFAGDIDIFVKKTYFANYPVDNEIWHDDVTLFDARKF